MTEPRIPPRPLADWDEAVDDALSVTRSPSNTRPAGTPAPPADGRSVRERRAASGIISTFAWHPALTKGFMPFNNHLFHSTLSVRVRELVTVRVCWLRRGEYEWAQHVRMARNAGLSEQEIDAIGAGPQSPEWGPLDAALLRAVDEIVADRYIGDETWKQLSEHLDRQQLMDLVFTIGNYDLLCMAFNTFGLQLDPGLPGFPPDAG